MQFHAYPFVWSRADRTHADNDFHNFYESSLVNLRTFVLSLCPLVMLAIPAIGHGPQIQITVDGGKIVTRELLPDGPYSNALSAPKSLYVMPVKPSAILAGTVWYSRPNTAINPSTLQPAFPSGPGLAYGYDLADGVGPQAFAAGSQITLDFTAGLKRWNGSAFVDPGVTQLMAFRGSNITAPTATAVTSDTGPFASLSVSAVEADYGMEGKEVHSGLRFAFLGDGTSYTSSVPDGIYLLSMIVSNIPAGPSPSNEFHFLLNKNSPWTTAQAAADSLGIPATLQQWTAPEPGAIGLAAIGLLAIIPFRTPKRHCRLG